MTSTEILAYVKTVREQALKVFVPVMRVQTAQLLAKIVTERQPARVLEIGTSVGTSGMTVLACSSAKLTTIEIDESTQEEAKANFAKCGLSDRVEFILGDCHEVVYYMNNNSYDFVIIDGPKSHYLQLLRWVLPMLDDTGCIFVDDTGYHELITKEGLVERKHRTIVRGLREFLTAIDNDKNLDVEHHNIEDGVVIIKKVRQ